MKTLRNTLAIALTAATLGLGMIATTTEASAFEGNRYPHIHRFGGHHWNNHFRFHARWNFRFHEHYRFAHYRFHCGRFEFCRPHYGYGRIHYGTAVNVGVAAPATTNCAPGTHLGYEGKYCWPNRQP